MKRNIIITGTNRGIGLELTKRYLENGDRVFAMCRKASEELRKTGADIIENVDVIDLKSLQQSAAKVEESADILICNAGIMKNEIVDQLDESAFESMMAQFNVNSLGPIRTFSALRSKLKPGAKVAMITSRMGSIADNTSGGRYGYRASKTALNMLSMSLSHDLKSKEHAIGIFHPGWVQTDMTNKTGDLTSEECSQNLYKRIEELNLDSSGKFFHSNGQELPW